MTWWYSGVVYSCLPVTQQTLPTFSLHRVQGCIRHAHPSHWGRHRCGMRASSTCAITAAIFTYVIQNLCTRGFPHSVPLLLLQEELVKIAKKLKKNNVAVDVVSFGDADANEEKLGAFTKAVNSGDSSHLVTVPAGTILSDQLFGSPIYQSVRRDSSVTEHPHVDTSIDPSTVIPNLCRLREHSLLESNQS